MNKFETLRYLATKCNDLSFVQRFLTHVIQPLSTPNYSHLNYTRPLFINVHVEMPFSNAGWRLGRAGGRYR